MAARTYAVSGLGALPFRIHFFGTLGGLTLGGPTAGNKRAEQYHGSCKGSKGSPIPTSISSPLAVALATPSAVASLSGIVTPAMLTPMGPRGFSFSHDLQNQRYYFSRKRKKKRAEEYPRPPWETKKKFWVFLSLGRNQQGKREIIQSLTKSWSLPSLSHSWLKAMEKNKTRLYFSLCLAENLRHSLSTLVKTGVTLSSLAENRKGKKKRCSLCVSHSVFLSKQKIKEEIAKANPILLNVKGTDDKTWRRDQHLMP